jgi:hypothetical protein
MPYKPKTSAQRRGTRRQGLPKFSATELAGRQARDKRRTLEQGPRHSAFLAEIKLARGCADCGYNKHPAALDFDHLPGHVKRVNLSQMNGWYGKAAIEAELAKCEVVCSNCHRIRTYERKRGN